MARIIGETEVKPFTTIIRCAQVSGPYNGIKGCFSQIEIGLEDIKASQDYEGDWSFSTVCPKCYTTLYIDWQLPPGIIDLLKNNKSK